MSVSTILVVRHYCSARKPCSLYVASVDHFCRMAKAVSLRGQKNKASGHFQFGIHSISLFHNRINALWLLLWHSLTICSSHASRHNACIPRRCTSLSRSGLRFSNAKHVAFPMAPTAFVTLLQIGLPRKVISYITKEIYELDHARHSRIYDRGQFVFNPMHYLALSSSI
jgi:hypothetical protein